MVVVFIINIPLPIYDLNVVLLGVVILLGRIVRLLRRVVRLLGRDVVLRGVARLRGIGWLLYRRQGWLRWHVDWFHGHWGWLSWVEDCWCLSLSWVVVKRLVLNYGLAVTIRDTNVLQNDLKENNHEIFQFCEGLTRFSGL